MYENTAHLSDALCRRAFFWVRSCAGRSYADAAAHFGFPDYAAFDVVRRGALLARSKPLTAAEKRRRAQGEILDRVRAALREIDKARAQKRADRRTAKFQRHLGKLRAEFEAATHPSDRINKYVQIAITEGRVPESFSELYRYYGVPRAFHIPDDVVNFRALAS